MSPIAVVCPHCGARQADRDPIAALALHRATSREDGVAVDPYRGQPEVTSAAEEERPPLQISAEETRALLEVTGIAQGGTAYERPAGPMALVLPRAEASGLTWALEWTLTFLAAPMIVLGLAPALMQPRLWRRMTRANEWALTLTSAFLGALVLFSVSESAGMDPRLTWGLAAVCGGALVARAIVRSVPSRL